MAWCSHCGEFCRTLLDVFGGYVSCAVCGKVLDQLFHFGSPALNNQSYRKIREILHKGGSEESESPDDSYDFESEGESDAVGGNSESSTIEEIEDEFGEKTVMTDAEDPGSVVDDNVDYYNYVDGSHSNYRDDYYNSEDVDCCSSWADDYGSGDDNYDDQ